MKTLQTIQTSANEHIAECDAKANFMIASLTTEIAIICALPAVVNWSLLVPTILTAITFIALYYDIRITKEEAGNFIKQCFYGAGLWWMGVNFGAKFVAALIQCTGLGYVFGCVLDGVITTAAAYAIACSAKHYFRNLAISKQTLSKEELGNIFRNAFAEYKRNNKK